MERTSLANAVLFPHFHATIAFYSASIACLPESAGGCQSVELTSKEPTHRLWLIWCLCHVLKKELKYRCMLLSRLMLMTYTVSLCTLMVRFHVHSSLSTPMVCIHLVLGCRTVKRISQETPRVGIFFVHESQLRGLL